MAQRATENASTVQFMENLLQTLPLVTPEELHALQDQQLCCTLSGDSVAEIMQDSHRDFFVFAMRVRRPEDVIDAPTALDVQQVLSGVYSNEAFRSAATFAVQNAGPDQ